MRPAGEYLVSSGRTERNPISQQDSAFDLQPGYPAGPDFLRLLLSPAREQCKGKYESYNSKKPSKPERHGQTIHGIDPRKRLIIYSKATTQIKQCGILPHSP